MTPLLGIESSCDETATTVIIDGRVIGSNVVASQVDIHPRYGGVSPEFASRIHIESITLVIEQPLRTAEVSLGEIEAIVVT